VGNPDDAEDLCQEVCLHCLLGQAQFRGDAEFTTWLYRITSNASKDLLRKKYRRAESVETEVGEEVFLSATEVQAEDAVLVERVQAALSKITPRQRQLLEWKFIEGLSHAEIAQQLGVKEQSAWVALHHAREAFKRAYEALDEEDS
jgi:RNA polymerase sigma-70 factor (ECF subfamily)